MSQPKYLSRLSEVLQKAFLERLKPEKLWQRMQAEHEVCFPPDSKHWLTRLPLLFGARIWLVLSLFFVGAVILDWQRFGLDLSGFFRCLGGLIFLALSGYALIVLCRYELVVRSCGSDIEIEERLIGVSHHVINMQDFADAIPAANGGVIVSFNDGERLLIGKHLGEGYSKIVAEFLAFAAEETRVKQNH